MSKLPQVKAAEVVRALERAGFQRVRQSGSHLRLKRGNLGVTVPMHKGDLRGRTLKSIIQQAGLTPDEFLVLLQGGILDKDDDGAQHRLAGVCFTRRGRPASCAPHPLPRLSRPAGRERSQ